MVRLLIAAHLLQLHGLPPLPLRNDLPLTSIHYQCYHLPKQFLQKLRRHQQAEQERLHQSRLGRVLLLAALHLHTHPHHPVPAFR